MALPERVLLPSRLKSFPANSRTGSGLCYPQARASGVHLIVADRALLESRFLHTSILVDRHKFSQVLRNVLSNALKFTPMGGSVTVKLYKGHPSTISSLATVNALEATTAAFPIPDEVYGFYDAHGQTVSVQRAPPPPRVRTRTASSVESILTFGRSNKVNIPSLRALSSSSGDLVFQLFPRRRVTHSQEDVEANGDIGVVEVEGGEEGEGPDGEVLVIEVVDTGAGISRVRLWREILRISVTF